MERRQRTKVPKRKGEDTRLAILVELRRREVALEPTPTGYELEDAVGMGRDTIWYHLRVLRRKELITQTGRFHLTDAGRAKADQGL